MSKPPAVSTRRGLTSIRQWLTSVEPPPVAPCQIRLRGIALAPLVTGRNTRFFASAARKPADDPTDGGVFKRSGAAEIRRRAYGSVRAPARAVHSCARLRVGIQPAATQRLAPDRSRTRVPFRTRHLVGARAIRACASPHGAALFHLRYRLGGHRSLPHLLQLVQEPLAPGDDGVLSDPDYQPHARDHRHRSGRAIAAGALHARAGYRCAGAVGRAMAGPA